MRVIECNICGETLSAANDEELKDCVRRHQASEHSDREMSEGEIGELVSSEAYEATDS